MIVLGLLAGLALGELWFRIVKPPPRRQMVRSTHCVRTAFGVPIWGCENRERTDRHNRACVEQHPERTRVLFFGSSITYGSNLTASEAFTTALEARLNELRPTPGFCIMNFAEPGFSFEQKFAAARTEVPRYRPALILWEDWAEWSTYSMIGDTAYGTTGLRIRPDGFIGLEGVPDGINRFLFTNSRLYEYIVLIYAEPNSERPSREIDTAEAFIKTRLVEVPRLARSVGAKLAFYLAPPLDRPFTETVASLPDWHEVLLDFARAQHVPAYTLQQELLSHDYLTVRMDDCCHYNAAGHQALVPIMERIVLEQLEGKPTT
jgi:hypothetical protein